MIKLSPMTKEDIPEVLSVEKMLARGSIIEENITKCVPYSFVVRCEDGHIVAYCVIFKDELEGRPGKQSLDIQSLAILTGWRRMGIGTSLLQNVIDTLDDDCPYIELFLYHSKHTEGLEAWYNQIGFDYKCDAQDQFDKPIHYLLYTLPDDLNVTRVNGKPILRDSGESILLPRRMKCVSSV